MKKIAVWYQLKNKLSPPVISTPLIDYTWSTQVNSGNMELVNSGTSGVTNDAPMFSGEGVKFDGVGNYINTGFIADYAKDYTIFGITDIANNRTFGSIDNNGDIRFCFEFFGSTFAVEIGNTYHKVVSDYTGVNYLKFAVTYNGTTKEVNITIFNMGITDSFTTSTDTVNSFEFYLGARNQADTQISYFTGVQKDFYIFDRILTQTEIDKYNTDPNNFFDDVRSGVIDNCVLNMPLDGTDKYIKDYQNYQNIEKVINGNFTNSSSWSFTNDASIRGGELILNRLNGESDAIAVNDGILIAGVTYTVTIDITALTAGKNIGVGSGTVQNSNITYLNPSATGVLTTSITASETGKLFVLGGGSEYTNKISSLSVKLVTGLYEITGYDATVRQNQLPYGSQEMKFLRDGNWRGAFSQYLELSIGHADTSWTPSETWQIEEVDIVGTTETHRVYNSDGTKYTNGVSDGAYTVPTTEIILNNTNIENITIDEYKIFRVYPTINDETTLYNNYVNPQATTQTIQLDGTMTGEQ